MTLEELKPLIISWAKAKDLIKPENADKQRLKLIEECGELASAILKKDIKLQMDSIGDIWVVLTILAAQTNKEINLNGFPLDIDDEITLEYALYMIIYNAHDYLNSEKGDFFDLTTDFLFEVSIRLNHDLIECANLAWNEIKDRKGKTISGTFIKESDCTENHILGHA